MQSIKFADNGQQGLLFRSYKSGEHKARLATMVICTHSFKISDITRSSLTQKQKLSL